MPTVLFLGTGAADTSPRIATEFPDVFRLNERRCSAVLIDRTILVDCGPHVMNSLRIAGADPGIITDLFITHFHPDHYRPETICALSSLTASPLRVHYRGDATPTFPENVIPCPAPVFTPVAIPGYTVTGFPSNHTEHPQFLSFEGYGKRFLYATDGAWFLGETVRAMKGMAYDAVFLDSTVGDYAGDFRMGEHNSIPMLRLIVPSMRTLKILREDSQIYMTHMAPTLHAPHEQIAETAAREGWIAAYDGLTVTI